MIWKCALWFILSPSLPLHSSPSLLGKTCDAPAVCSARHRAPLNPGIPITPTTCHCVLSVLGASTTLPFFSFLKNPKANHACAFLCERSCPRSSPGGTHRVLLEPSCTLRKPPPSSPRRCSSPPTPPCSVLLLCTPSVLQAAHRCLEWSTSAPLAHEPNDLRGPTSRTSINLSWMDRLMESG